jgi:hypothetical protein
LIPFSSNQFEHEIVNEVVVVPLRGLIEQEPFWGGWFRIKFNALELISDENE